jgi:hypothetical protein
MAGFVFHNCANNAVMDIGVREKIDFMSDLPHNAFSILLARKRDGGTKNRETGFRGVYGWRMKRIGSETG